jgi:hypothetical protein
MKNKTITLLVVLSLLVLPAVALAAKAEPAGAGDISFTLGGYIKLHMFWDSALMGKNWNQAPPLNNNPDSQHGRFNATSQSSRFNFTIKGPDLWGAKTTGYIEVDFDRVEDRQTASNAWQPRMRHAFFRMNWPGTELLLGQYWSYFCEFYPDMIQDGPYQGHGVATHRLAQARLTQTFGLGWAKDDVLTLSAMVGAPTDTGDTTYAAATPPATNADRPGQASETPQLGAKIQYEGNLWGMGPFYGAPKPFTAQVSAGWQRTRYRAQFGIAGPDAVNQQYLNNWMVQGTLFLPIIPTNTKDLSGTMAVTVQAYVGQGLDAFGNQTGFNSYLDWTESIDGDYRQRKLVKNWGGYVLANYHFTNQWYMNAGAGLGNNFGVNLWTAQQDATFGNQVHQWWEANINLFYRPITAIKFGLGYAYTRADYYRIQAQGGSTHTLATPNRTNIGEAHRVQFAGWFFF